ncbi:MAG TPA: hypothetical protein VK789_11820 [Bryobacteraceae bacterium]|jgi:hypothetical protein|nr:hypothetical protein [Bryobacteraceae bacterium]
MAASFPYQRIGPATPHITGHDSLWLADDHLLVVHNTRFVEDYLRFDLNEIQAIIIRRQFRFVVPVYWLLGCIAAFIVAIAGTVRGSSLTDLGWGALVLLGIYWLFASLAGSCSCHLQTAVDCYELPGLYRDRAARRVVQLLEQRIAVVQGTLPQDWAAPDTSEGAMPHSAPDAELIVGTLSSAFLPALACLALLLDALISWLVRTPNVPGWLRTLGVIVTLAAIVLPIVAIAVTRRDKRYRHIRVLFLIAVFAVGFANYGSTMTIQFLAAVQQAGRPAPGNVNGVNDVLYWINQIAEVGMGGLGILFLLAETRGGTLGRPSSAP